MKSISFPKSLLGNFLIPFVFVSFCVWILIPAGYDAKIPLYWLEIPVYTIFFGGLIVITLVAIRREGSDLTLQHLTRRLRIKTMSKKDWVWTLYLLAFSVFTYLLLTGTADWIKTNVIFAPNWLDIPDTLYGMQIKGNWWLVVIQFLILILNVIGEEIWFHGYLLPRQELAHKKRAWVVNGIFWYAYHLFWPWNVVRSLPETIASSFVCQKLQNTTPAIVSHFLFNGIGLILLILEIAK